MPFLLTGEPSEGESALMVAATIGSALRNRRRDLGIDQSDAAALIGMSRTTFSSYERDLQRPSAEVLPALAQFVAVSIEEMLALYGATCIETLRPSLERFLAANESSIKNRSPKYQGSPLDEAPVNHSAPDDAIAIRDDILNGTSKSMFANELADGFAPSKEGTDVAPRENESAVRVEAMVSKSKKKKKKKRKGNKK